MSKKQFAVIAAANALLATYAPSRDYGSDNVSDVVTAANESRFDSANFSQALTQYAVGWRPQENLLDMMEYLAPTVPVSRRFEFKKAINGEYYLSEQDDIRAIGGSFKRVEHSGESVNEKTLNKGLTIRVDKDEAQGEGWQERKVAMLLHRIYLNELRRVVIAMGTAATNENIDWKIGDKNKDPDGSVTDMLLAAVDEAGIQPDRIAYGATAWQYRSKYYRTIDTQLSAALYGMSPEQMAGTLGVASARVIEARYQETVKAATKSKVLGAKVYGFFAQSGIGKDDPSNLKRFVSPTAQGGQRAVYIEDHPKFVDITVEHYSNVVVTSAVGLRSLTVTQTAA